MSDQISIDRINTLHPAIRGEVVELYTKASALMPEGIIIRITQALRSIEYQNKLYAQGRTAPGKIVTNAMGGRSYHNYGLAFDFCLIKDGKVSWEVDKNWQLVASVFKNADYIWGGDFKRFKDYPHLEKTFGYNWRGLLDKYNKKLFIEGTEYVIL